MRKKNKSFPKKTAILLAASAVLLLGSAVGSTRAALTYYSENYSAQVDMSHIGVTLLENGEPVSHRNYDDNGNLSESEPGVLLENLLGEEEKFTPGKSYQEELRVQNSGDIDTFVRVILTRSWQDADGNKDVSLDPELIELDVLEENGWILSTDPSSPERIVAYYSRILPAGSTTTDLIDSLRIKPEIATDVTRVEEGNTIRYEYKYSGYSFTLEAEADAVQTHNAEEAIKSAWGVDVTVNGDTLSLQ